MQPHKDAHLETQDAEGVSGSMQFDQGPCGVREWGGTMEEWAERGIKGAGPMQNRGNVCGSGHVPSLVTFYLYQPTRRRGPICLHLCFMWILHMGVVEGRAFSVAICVVAVSLSCLCGTGIPAQLSQTESSSHIPQLRERPWVQGWAPAARQEGVLGLEVLEEAVTLLTALNTAKRNSRC